MKSERRHELETNELADWVGHLPIWVKQNRNMLIYIAVVLVITGVLYYLKYARVDTASRMEAEVVTDAMSQLDFAKARILQGQSQGMNSSDVILEVVGRIEASAAGVENPSLAALALIKRAQALRVEMHYIAKSPPREIFSHQINQAKKLYTEAISIAADNTTLVAMATFGTGLCAEELGDSEEAAAIYNDITTNLEFAGTIFPAEAALRMSSLDENKSKVFFARSAPAPAPAGFGPADTDIIVPLRSDDEIAE